MKLKNFHNRSVFLFSALNASLYVAQDNMTDDNPVLEHQESMSKTQLQVEEQKTAKGERLTSKYSNYTWLYYFKFIISEGGFSMVHEYVYKHIFCRKFTFWFKIP